MVTSTEKCGGASAHRGPDEVVDRVPLPGDEGGPGVGDTAWVVRFENGRGGGQSGTHRFGPSAEAGEEVGLDKAGDDADIRLDVATQQLDRHTIDLTDRHVIGAVRIVVDDGVAGHDVGSHDSSNSAAVAWRWLPVAHSSVMAASGIPQRARWRSRGGSTVRLGMGRVRSGKTTTTRGRPPPTGPATDRSGAPPGPGSRLRVRRAARGARSAG